MTQKESTLVNSEKMSQQWDHLETIDLTYRDQVQVRSRLLYTELTMVSDILGKILDSVRELEQLRQEQQ